MVYGAWQLVDMVMDVIMINLIMAGNVELSSDISDDISDSNDFEDDRKHF